jgi:branched-chain amino acid transport system permease protein
MSAWVRRSRLPLAVVGVLVVGLGLDPYLQYLIALVAIYAIACVGYNLLMGFAGQFGFGHAAFFGIGAFGTAILAGRVGAPYPLGVLGGVASALVVGLVLGVIVLRLSGLYLALVTLSFNEIVVLGLSLWRPVTGGFDGIGMSAPRLPSIGLGGTTMVYLLSVLLLLGLLWATGNVLETRVGRAFTLIRDNPIAAQAFGVDITRTRVLAFALSGAYGALAGGLYAPLVGHITPQGFGLFTNLQLLTMIVVGGLGSLSGSVLGAVVVLVVPELLRSSQASLEITYGAVLLVAVLFLPNGLSGLHRHPLLRRVRAWRLQASQA